MQTSYQFTIGLNEVGMEHLDLVGGKNASLGEMIRNLTPRGIAVPDGFAITVTAYRAYLQHNNLDAKIHEIISSIDMSNLISLRKGGTQLRQLIRNGRFPQA